MELISDIGESSGHRHKYRMCTNLFICALTLLMLLLRAYYPSADKHKNYNYKAEVSQQNGCLMPQGC